MRKLLFLISVILLFTACNFNPKGVEPVTEFCFTIEEYNKTICLSEPHDSLYPVLYIDKNYFEMRDRKFTGLKMYIMMVVEIDENNVTFSNPNYSIKVKYDRDISISLPSLQDIYYIIVKREHLSNSKLVIYSDGVKEDLPTNEDMDYDSMDMDVDEIDYSGEP